MSTPLPTAARADGAPTFRVTPRRVVSALWLFLILNYAYCDILGLFYAPDLNELLTGEIGGIEMSQTALLGAGVLMTVPMSMVLISRVAPFRFARWSAFGAGIVMALVQVGSLFAGSGNTAHYLYFSVIEIATAAFIAWYAAARWRVDA